jgi:hypothetical protein
MTITIHQPEYLPYIGFFRKAVESDIFIILDDVNYQKNAFINRNKIKTAKGVQWITVPIKERSSNLKINEVLISNQTNWQESQWKTLIFNYSKAPCFKEYSNFFKKVFNKKWEKISDLDIYLIENIINFLKAKTMIKKSSELNVSGKGMERLINICKTVKADTYLSGKGSEKYHMELKDIELFEKNGIKVLFQDFNHPKYNQLFEKNMGFISNLSIIDLLFNYGEKSFNIIKNKKI